MGNLLRAMRYDQASNKASAVPMLQFNGEMLHWYRLDDGVMGGQSVTDQSALQSKSGNSSTLHFQGTINTNGGGFTSIRAELPSGLPPDTDALRLRFRGDGKTYKLLLSDGRGTGGPPPFNRGSPSWQVDVNTDAMLHEDHDAGEDQKKFQEVTVPLSSFLPSYQGKALDATKHTLVPGDMTQIGLMLSLFLSNGSPNPKETFGEGEFEYKLEVWKVEAVCAKKPT